MNKWLIWYREQGLNVIALPLQTKGEAKTISWKQYEERKTTVQEQQEMLKDLSNIALINGKTSNNTITIDIDDKKLWEKKLLGSFPDTFTVETSRGVHLHYTVDILPKNQKLKQYGIEILSQGSIAIMPPSIHESGWVYRPYKGSKRPEHNTSITHFDGDIQEFIYDLIKNKLDKTFKPAREIVNIDQILKGVQEGTRNDAALKLATWYRKSGLDYESCHTKMMEWDQKNKPPCEGDDYKALENTIRQAYKNEEPYHYAFNRRPQQTTTFPTEIKEKAEKILAEGKALDYINETAHSTTQATKT